ncbi:MAG: tail fiber domain-containing protein [Candidatus Marinimicrobia bacterium]|nr:tail fiber domain-containing protein [Candidatus Neomarinimicrobiota bacterium]
MGTALILAPLCLLQAQIPRTLSYQGIVTDAAGDIKPDGSYSFAFKLYDVSSGGTALWTESKTLSVKDGLFSTALGDQVVFPSSLAFDQPYWLSIKVGSEAELSPRTPLTSVGYSFHALRADTAEYARQTPTGEGLTLPYSGTNTANEDAFSITTTGTGWAIRAVSSSGGIYVTTDGLGKVGYFEINNPSNSNQALRVNTTGTGNAGYFRINNTSSDEEAIFAQTTGTGYAGYFSGDVYTTGSYQGSDIRWKRNITSLEGALEKVLALRGVQFEWNLDDYPDRGFHEGKQIGFIAQEVEEILPELVRENKDGYKAVDYPKITAVLMEAIKEQQKQIEQLKAAVAALQGQFDVALRE